MQNTSWIDPQEYPFTSHFLDLDAGRMHYIDEGSGPPIVMVHGTPTWSFLYRHLIKDLSSHYRCIAMDHIGFGLSDKPPRWSYQPEDHAKHVHALIDHLALRDMVLVVHDFGGPIGLSYAIEHPDTIRGLVLFNTWMWSLQENMLAMLASTTMNSPLGELLYLYLNWAPEILIKIATGNREELTRPIQQHYAKPFTNPAERHGPWTFARALSSSSAWYEELWQQRQQIKEKPALILWGMKDPGFSEQDLLRWQVLFPHAQTMVFPNVGHFVPEEEGKDLGPVLLAFLHSIP